MSPDGKSTPTQRARADVDMRLGALPKPTQIIRPIDLAAGTHEDLAARLGELAELVEWLETEAAGALAEADDAEDAAERALDGAIGKAEGRDAAARAANARTQREVVAATEAALFKRHVAKMLQARLRGLVRKYDAVAAVLSPRRAIYGR